MLRALMREIEKQEIECPEPHNSSFGPIRVVDGGGAGPSSGLDPNLSPSQFLPAATDPPEPLTLRSRQSSIPIFSSLMRTTTDTEQELAGKRKAVARTEASQHAGVYLACHYFDFIGGTSTGGSVSH